MVDGFLDHLFKDGELNGLCDAVGDGEFGLRAFVLEDDLVFFDLHAFAVDEGELINLRLMVGLFFEVFEGADELLLFF